MPTSVALTFALVLAAAQAAGSREEPASLAAGHRAFERGALEEAEAHYLAALDGGGVAREALAALLALAAARQDADSYLASLHDWALVAAGPSGAVPSPPPGPAPKNPASKETGAKSPAERWPAELAKLRVAAAQELVAAAAERTRGVARDPGGVLVAAWLRRLALELVQPMPEAQAALADGLDPTVHAVEGGHVTVLKALDRVMTTANANGRIGEAIRAARIMHGLGVQAEFSDLEGPRPGGMARWRATGAEMLARARQRLAEAHPDPWTVDELEWLSSDEGEAFTRAHASFALPGVAVSPRGWYRVESDCGYETLLGVARTIEDHHRRLAGFFGADPFVTDADTAKEKVVRQGIIRVVPNSDGLEAEGAPYFWAGGFQAGDVTVMRFSVGDIEGLGHGLTHELTHRFDGALNPGIPAWLAEGKAVWTGAAYGHSSERDFVPTHASFGTPTVVLGKGYGGVGVLGALIAGEPKDYRENYSAGYALYLYLSTWPLHGERRLYQARLAEFERSGGARDASAARAKFSAHFCDGKEGRPDGLEAFAAAFGEFLAGFYWKEPAPWRSHYTEDVPQAPRSSWVYDDPTWVWSWQRAEPTFGQDQARLAGELFLDVDRRDDALAALVWARSQDGFVPRTHWMLARALAGAKRSSDVAWLVRAELGFPHAALAAPTGPLEPGPPPGPAPMLAGLRATRALLDGYVAALAATETPRARALLVAEHTRLARWVGAPESFVASAVAPPREQPPVLLAGWEDARLAGYDEDRPRRAFAALGADLMLGRKEDRTGTGRFDRSGGQRAFALAEPWLLPGAYRVRTRVRFTTGFNELEVVVGTTRRDRNVRFRVTAGSFMFAIGEEDDEPEFEEISFGFSGLRDRDPGLAGAARAGTHKMDRSKTVVDIELLVDGASVTAYLDGVEVASYHTIDGSPIEGRVGFAVRYGAVRLERPTVQRLDRGVLTGRPLRSPRALDLGAASAPSFDGLENLPLRGLALSSTGKVVLWVARDEGFAALESFTEKVTKAMKRLSERAFANGVVQPLAVVVPSGLTEEQLVGLRQHGQGLDPRVEVAVHALTSERVGEAADLGKRWLLFVDAAGVVREALPWLDGATLREPNLVHWLTVFRENGAPPRELPPVERRKD